MKLTSDALVTGPTMKNAVDTILFQAAAAPMVLVGDDLRIRLANPAFREQFAIRERPDGRLLCGPHGLWKSPEIEPFLHAVFAERSLAADLRVQGVFPGVGNCELQLRHRAVAPEGRTMASLLSVDVRQVRGEELPPATSAPGEIADAMSEILMDLAHESRNVLQRGQACLEMMARRLGDRPDLVELIREAQQAQDDLHDLYQQVLGYAEALPKQWEHCRIGQLFGEAWAQVMSMNGLRDAKLVSDPALQHLRCVADPNTLRHSFCRILNGLLSASMEPTEIHVVCQERTSREVRLAVRDNRPPASAAPQEQSYRHLSTAVAGEGGLDLVIARRLLAVMHGTIARDTGCTEGTQFVITLPGAAS